MHLGQKKGGPSDAGSYEREENEGWTCGGGVKGELCRKSQEIYFFPTASFPGAKGNLLVALSDFKKGTFFER